jgi:N-acetylglucosamine kinase-like BadF-type ATPase
VARTPLVELPPELTAATPRRESPSGDGRYLLGVDGGATKTLAAVLDIERETLHVGHGGPSNEDAVGAKAAVEALLGAADQALAAAGIEEQQIGAAVLAIAGTDTASIAGHVRAARGDSWLVVNDVVGAWASATGGGPGVAAISGTGSNVFGVGRDGKHWRTGGWGHVLGDEGSGYWVGAESIRAALRDRDASGPPTELGDAVAAFFGVASVEALATLVYSKPLSKSDIAGVAVETARVAERGDEVARALFAHGAELLGGQIATVIAQTGLEGVFPVGLIGSAYKAGEVFLGPLRARIHDAAPAAEVAIVEMAPVGGSLLLAARMAGREDALDASSLTDLIAGALRR